MEKELEKIKYSVLMSVYERDNEKYVELAIESMLNQTCSMEQFVVVLDGPVRAEVNTLLQSYKSRYPSIFTIVKLKENKGLANALNVGLQFCRNELVARMDADDISLPERCEKILKAFSQNKDLAICGCNIGEFYNDYNEIRTLRIVPSNHADIVKFMKRRQPFNHPTVIYRKSIVLEVGGYIPLKRKEDFDLFSRILSSNFIAKNIGEVLYLYRADEGNYQRRRSWLNFKNAIYVYYRHYQRKGCNLFDFVFICLAELMFLLMPIELMKLISDRVLRKKLSDV